VDDLATIDESGLGHQRPFPVKRMSEFLSGSRHSTPGERMGGCGAFSVPVSALSLFRAKLVEVGFGEAEK
jgi:hypothetical protein